MSELRRSLSMFDLTMIAIGSSIGSGIFLTPGYVAKALPSPVWILAVWFVGGVMALCGALTYAELGAMMPRAGGVYVFLSEAYGGLTGFLYGWAYFLVVNTGALAALAVGFSTYLGALFSLSPSGMTAAAVLGILFVTAVNVLGVKSGGIFSDVFTLLKLAGIAMILVVGFGWGSHGTIDLLTPLTTGTRGLTSGITIAFVSVLWSYGGWQHATFTAAEARNPQTTVPRALIIGASVVTLAYLLTNVAYMYLLPVGTMGNSACVASDAIVPVLGQTGGKIISLAIFISMFGTTGIYTLTAPRIYFAMANDGVFFKRVSEVHPRFHTPVFSIVIQSAWAITLIFLWGTYEKLISYVVFADWIFFALAALSIFVFRRRNPQVVRPYKTLGYPFTPLLFILLASLFVVYTLIEKPVESGAGLLFLGLGVPVYYFWKRRSTPSTSLRDVPS